ncbi:2Fe-2S iron-sulfur cluster-binding protein [Rhodococcus rhodochrous]|uniref:2Fe-2S iron-sulfur cluster binding domain-containing protein n=1 Tax=Rhodococcus rhodochrous TaxID=1829 RepID=A0AA46WV21_RHORH|nr:2Fe-2S iron-sulfur cluster binding domain-containing protein [Rhodococcus sp. Rp3]UZF44337.1 2Fe-2S iron-sulfur cluster binding domain-containing protein [Rhodococcus rhodochrous]
MLTRDEIRRAETYSISAGIESSAGAAPPACTTDGRSITLPLNGTESVWDVLDAHSITLPLGCASGHCGSCTVLLGDVPVPACIVPHAEARGRDIATIATASEDALVTAMMEHGAVQCGFCSPGIVVTLSWLIRGAAAEGRVVTVDEVRDALTGHLCRCTGYAAVVSAAVAASKGFSGNGQGIDEAGTTA